MDSLKEFAQTEDGMVTVEFVMMTAALVALGLAAAAIVSTGVEDLSSETAETMGTSNITQMSRFDLAPPPATDPE